MGLKKVGALWAKSGKKGRFLSGVLEVDGGKIDVFVFPNDKDGNEKRPDYNIMIRFDNEVVAGDSRGTDDNFPF